MRNELDYSEEKLTAQAQDLFEEVLTKAELIESLKSLGNSLDVLNELTENWDLVPVSGQDCAVVYLPEEEVVIPTNGMTLIIDRI
jgi:hypothetical protein